MTTDSRLFACSSTPALQGQSADLLIFDEIVPDDSWETLVAAGLDATSDD